MTKTFYKVDYIASPPRIDVISGEEFSDTYIKINGRRVKKHTLYDGIFDDYESAKDALYKYLDRAKESLEEQLSILNEKIARVKNRYP